MIYNAASRTPSPTAYFIGAILKLELLSDLSPEEVSNLWLEYHKDKESVSAVIPTSTYTKMMDRASVCPMFLCVTRTHPKHQHVFISI